MENAILENNIIENENSYTSVETTQNIVTLETIHEDLMYNNSLLLWSLCVVAVILFVLFINKIFTYFE